MKNEKIYILLLLALSITIFINCKKETSCENCIGGNIQPLANAGPDQTITLPADSAILDGSATSDPDGSIRNWLWRNIANPGPGGNSFNIIEPTKAKTVVSNLNKGIYQFELKVTDNKGLSATDTIQINVSDPTQPNRPPIANADSDQTIALPINTVIIVGIASTDPDNNITNYDWSKISGPPSFNILAANVVQTQVTNLVVGTYQFELKVTDAGGLFDKDTLLVTVEQGTSTSTVDVYVAGSQNNLPVYWKNGQAVPLDNQAHGFTGNSIATVGSTVFVAGTRNELVWSHFAAKYWNNGQGVTIGNYAGATSIAVAGNDVYVAGWEWVGNQPSYAVAKYWKNGIGVALTDGNKEAYANSIVVIGNDIYVAGEEGGVAKYWKNGQAVQLSNGSNQGYANSITVIGSDIYVAGSESNGSYNVAKYWKNGQSMPLSNGPKHASAKAIVVVGNDVYVAGSEGDDYGMVGGTGRVAKYWKNGQEVSLTNGTTYAYANSITVFGSDVYIAGTEFIGSNYYAKYWKNGQEVLLASNGMASSIVVVNR